MPRDKEDATDFDLSVTWNSHQYKVTVPKVLIDRIIDNEDIEEFTGKWILSRSRLKLLQAEPQPGTD